MGLLAGAIVDADDHDETDSVLEHIARSIGNGETAVLADLDENGPVAVDAVMAALDGTVSRFARRDVEAEIAGAEEAAHEARVKARKELRHQRREATVEKVQAKLRELRERLQHLVHH
jgi:hypothetical protein